MTIFTAICDDEKRIGAELECYLIKMFNERHIKYEIDVYFSGADLCEKMQEGVHYDLIFLDIEYAKDEINGVEVGTLIRDEQKNNFTSIVYISWEEKYSMQLFDTQPLHFLTKPLTYEKVERAVEKHINMAGVRSSHFSYKIGHDAHKIRIENIVYLESSGRKLIIHLANGNQEEFYGSLKKVYKEQLQKFDFLFIHASYAVNYDHIEVHKYEELTLANGDITLPISQDRRKAVRGAYLTITKRREM